MSDDAVTAVGVLFWIVVTRIVWVIFGGTPALVVSAVWLTVLVLKLAGARFG